MANDPEQERFMAHLEGLGVDEVRQGLARNQWNDANNRKGFAEEFVSRQERVQSEAALAEQTSIARAAAASGERSAVAAERSANAAEGALRIARAANMRTSIGLLISLFAAVVALGAIFWNTPK